MTSCYEETHAPSWLCRVVSSGNPVESEVTAVESYMDADCSFESRQHIGQWPWAEQELLDSCGNCEAAASGASCRCSAGADCQPLP